MDCPQFEEALADLDRPGTQGAVLREIALAHAESCSHCASLLTESESLDFSLHSLAAHTASRTAPARVETALLQQFRKEKGLAARRKLQWQLSILGAAAVLVLAFGISLHRRIFRFPGTASDGGTFVQPSVSSQSAAGNITPYGFANDTEDATAFTPLPYADDPSALDGGAVVRVELSASALASLGFPVTDMSDTSRISADLVVSDDGTPQAIRLVSPESLKD